MVTTISKDCSDIKLHFECSGNVAKYLKAYKDGGGVWTIGIGTIQYPNGQRVKQGDVITLEQAYSYCHYDATNRTNKVNVMTRDDINQNQLDSLVSICYNIGSEGLRTSKLLKLVNANLNDLNIVNRFCDWRWDNGKFIPGLLRRRMAEAYLFFTGKLKFNWVNYKTNNPAAAAAEVRAAIKAALN
jgi:lysozyme